MKTSTITPELANKRDSSWTHKSNAHDDQLKPFRFVEGNFSPFFFNPGKGGLIVEASMNVSPEGFIENENNGFFLFAGEIIGFDSNM